MSDYEAGYDPKYGFNRNAFEHRPVHLKVIGGIVRNIAKPIGLVSESMAHTKDKKRTSENSASVGSLRDVQEKVEAPVPANPQTGLKDPEKGEVDMDEENWALDEAVPEVDDDLSNAVPQGDKQTEVAALMRSIQLPTSDKNTREKLPFPVVLPQRRPGTKARSFVRAYAPVLQDSGISQETFLGFLHSFYKASQASPIFDIIIIGCNLASAYPNPIVGAACFGVQVATAAAQEVQERWKTNKFLDSANKEIFMPRGLYALIVTYKSTDSNTLECETKTVDIGAQAVAKYGQHLLDDDDLADLKPEERDSKMKERMNRLRIASGETHGEKEMPLVCAPLVFPALEAIADSAEHGDENALDKIVAKSQSAGTFVADYFDRRAQATFRTNNKDSTLANITPEPQFKSKMGDPNDARNFHLITLLTGGKIKAEPLGAKRRWEKAQRKAAESEKQGRKAKSVKRGLKENVLYLMVVNMPTDAELEQARKEMQEAKAKKRRERAST